MAETPAELAAEAQKIECYLVENPEGRYFVPLANTYRKMGEVDRAEALLREGLRKHPDYLSAHIVLGRCLADRGAIREAEEEFRHVLGVDPQNLIALRTLGELAVARGDTAGAERWYGDLLAVDPMNDEARQALETLPPPPPEGGEWEARAEMEDEPVAVPDFPAWDDAGSSAGAEDRDADYGDLRLESYEESWEATEEDEAGGGFSVALRSAASEDEELVTETIADLYARQGLYDRAVDVYRELIRRGGDDPALARRLAEVQGLAAGAAPLPVADEFGDDEFGDDGSGDGGFGGEIPESIAPRTIAERLIELVAWTPRSPAPSDDEDLESFQSWLRSLKR